MKPAKVRRLLRVQLGWPKSDAGDTELLSEQPMRGMRMERRLVGSIRARADKLQLGFVPAVRHLMRTALGMGAEESLRREARFAQIAEARREIMEADQ